MAPALRMTRSIKEKLPIFFTELSDYGFESPSLIFVSLFFIFIYLFIYLF